MQIIIAFVIAPLFGGGLLAAGGKAPAEHGHERVDDPASCEINMDSKGTHGSGSNFFGSAPLCQTDLCLEVLIAQRAPLCVVRDSVEL